MAPNPRENHCDSNQICFYSKLDRVFLLGKIIFDAKLSEWFLERQPLKCLNLLYPTFRVLLPYTRSHEVCGALGGLIVLLEQVTFSVYLQLL